jgi:hypothetical protein
MIAKIRITCVFIFILITIPFAIAIADVETPRIYGVTIHLKNNEKLDGYIETYWNLNACNQNKKDRATWSSFLEGQRERFSNESKDKVTLTFIAKLIEIKYDKAWVPFAAKSSAKEIKIDDIKSIEGVCRNWDGLEGSITRITDYMAEYISNHKLIAVYKYEEDDGNAYCHTTYLSYNPKYTREMLMKNRKIIDKMTDDTLDKEKWIRFAHCSN